MAKLLIEIDKNWLMIETIPITRKTNSEIINRIPDTRLWRANYLSHIIKSPDMQLGEWAGVPSLTISIIYECIEDLLSEYEAENKILNSVLDKIQNEDYTKETLKEMAEVRDHLVKNIMEKEGDEKVFKYSKEKISQIRKENEIAKSPISKSLKIIRSF